MILNVCRSVIPRLFCTATVERATVEQFCVRVNLKRQTFSETLLSNCHYYLYLIKQNSEKKYSSLDYIRGCIKKFSA
jgi:hypothetical protein